MHKYNFPQSRIDVRDTLLQRIKAIDFMEASYILCISLFLFVKEEMLKLLLWLVSRSSIGVNQFTDQ